MNILLKTLKKLLNKEHIMFNNERQKEKNIVQFSTFLNVN